MLVMKNLDRFAIKKRVREFYDFAICSSHKVRGDREGKRLI